MDKYLKHKRHVNGKLVFHKPSLFYCITLYAFVRIIFLAFLTFQKISFSTYYKISPNRKAKINAKYPDAIEKNETITFSEYDGTTPSENGGFERVEEIHEMKMTFSDEIIIVIILDIVLILYYKIRKIWKVKIIKCSSGLSKDKCTIFSGRRMRHLHLKTRSISIDAELHISKLMSEESVAIFKDLNVNHQNLFINTKENPEILYNLKQYMFYLTWENIPGHLPPFIDIVVYVKDILEGVQYLHDNDIYHLNISPENILIVECLGRASGMAKISGFEFSTHSKKRIVEDQKVGLEFLYRPPECFAENVVDASALDVWSIGVTAFEVLTGGMLTIQAEWKHSGQRCQELIEEQGLLKLDNFSSAVDSCWQYTRFLGGITDVVKIGDTKYNLSPCGFLRNSWKFVNSLLQFCPLDRATISEALNAPFITKTINPKFVCSFKCYRSEAYIGICPK